jgi:formylglycine-generating enzyme required for sulfatase activity
LYSTFMTTDFPNNFGVNLGIAQSGSAGSYSYSPIGNGNMPVSDITWGDAGRFCNWLQNGQPTGAEGSGTTETGAYTFNGDTMSRTETRNSGVKYFLPSQDEWYKAAYYKGGSTNAGYWLYPTRSNTEPSNLLSQTGTNNANFYYGGFSDRTRYLTTVGYFADSPGPYGTFDMGGDVWQWNETIIGGLSRAFRGGSFYGSSDYMASSNRYDNGHPTLVAYDMGFRVAASVPEPGSITLLLCGAIAGLICWRRRR